jgi:hypothetical protein
MPSEINSLPINKTVVFNCPIEFDDVIVRTGTIMDSSLFHSILHAYSKEYMISNINDRMKIYNKLICNIADDIDKTHWESIDNGELSRKSIQENFEFLIEKFHKYLHTGHFHGKMVKTMVLKLLGENPSENQLNAYRILSEIISLDNFISILDIAKDKIKYKYSLSIYSKAINRLSIEFFQTKTKDVDHSKRTFLEKLVTKLIDIVFEMSVSESFKNYILNEDIEVDSSLVSILSNKINRDIYFINSETRLPYNIHTENIYKRRKSIVILLINNHFEVIGRLRKGNSVDREFKPDDNFINKLYTLIIHPEDIKSRYPELLPCIPISYKTYMERSSGRSPGRSLERSPGMSPALLMDRSLDRLNDRLDDRSDNEHSNDKSLSKSSSSSSSSDSEDD